MKKDVKINKIIIDGLVGRRKSEKVLCELRYDYELNHINEFIDKVLTKKNQVSNFFKCGLYTDSQNNLFNGKLPYYRPNYLEKELIWNAIVIRKYATQIKKFINLKSQFENVFLNGEYKKASEILECINKTISYSVWSLESKFLVEEYDNGLEGNKRFLNEVNQGENNSELFIIADIFSYKVEKTITDAQYKNRMGKLISRLEEGIFKSYIKMRIDRVNNFSDKELADILIFEGLNPIIDRYLTFVKVCQYICSSENLSSQRVVKKCLNIIGDVIKDSQLKNMMTYFKIDVSSDINELDIEMNEILHCYTKGEYKTVVKQCEKLFENYSNCFEIYECYMKAMIFEREILRYNSETFKNLILKNMYDGYVKQADTINAYNNLAKYIRILNGCGFSIGLLSWFINRFTTGKVEKISRLAELNCQFSNPRFCLVYQKNDERMKYINSCKSVLGGYAHIEIFEWFYCKDKEMAIPNDIEGDRGIWYGVKKEIFNNSNIEAVTGQLTEMLEERNKSEKINDYRYEKILNELFNLLIMQEQYEKCMDLYINHYLSNKNVIIRLDRQKLYQLITKNLNQSLKENIALPILTHICYKGQNIKLFSAYANLLDAIRIKRPSELISISTNFDEKKLIYFLRFVCVPEVMDSTYSVFSSDESVDNERIEICNFLRDIDNKNDNTYVNEISQITQNSSLQQRMQFLDESRIDIDLQKVRFGQEEVLKENYIRFKDIGNFDISYDILDVNDQKVFVIKNYVDENDNIGVIEKKNQQIVLFKEMFFDYRDEFAFGQYGLNCSLSTRIRHGRLQNQLRNVFEQYNLVYFKESDINTVYIPDEQLEEMLLKDGFDKDFIIEIHKLFSKFSKNVDDKIDEINFKWVQIKTERDNSDGVLNFSFNENQLMILYSDLNRYNNVELIMDYFEKVLMETLDQSLRTLRNLINNTLKSEFVNYINQLEKEFDLLFRNVKNDTAYLTIKQNIINCRTVIQNEVTKIAEWFKPPQKKEFTDYTFKQLLETCDAVNRKLHSAYNDIQINITNNTQSKLKGYSFSHFIEIFIILFNNAITRAGFFGELKKLQIEVEIEEKETSFRILFANNLADSLDKNTVSTRIYETIQRIKDCEDKPTNDFEGGSGYVKISKMLKHNICIPWEFFLGIDDRNYYFAEFILVKKEVITEDDYESINN